MAKEDHKGIWVFAEQEHGVLHPTVFELLAKAGELQAVCARRSRPCCWAAASALWLRSSLTAAQTR